MDQARLVAEMRAECACCSVDILHDMLKVSDEAVAKALMLSEIAQIAKNEVRLREFMLAKWRIRSKQAADVAGRIITGGGTLAAAFKAANKAVSPWHRDVEARFKQNLAQTYRLARIAAHKKAAGHTKASLQYQVPNFNEQIAPTKKAKTSSLNPSFDVVDEAAIATLETQQVAWLGEFFDERIAPTITSAVEPAMLAGLGRVEAGKLVREKLTEKLATFSAAGGWHGNDAKYFEGLAANSTTQARVSGSIRSFERLRVTKYELSNPNDDRTSIICRFMDGKVYTVKEGADQLAAMGRAKNPDQMRKAAPWLPFGDVKSIYSKGGTSALAAEGFALPPFHFRCRTTVDVYETTSSAGEEE